MLALVAAVPAAAASGNLIDQGPFVHYAKGNELFSNEWKANQGGAPPGYAPMVIGGGANDVALAAANCQLVVAVDVHMAAIAAAGALAVISDEDDVAITETGVGRSLFGGLFDAESADADCDTAVGPILIDVTTSAGGWGEPAPFGSLADMVSALDGGKGGKGGGYGNKIEQGRFAMDAYAHDIVHNEWHLHQAVSNGAAAAANCQAVIAVSDSFVAAALAQAGGTIEDNDAVVITGAGGGARPTDASLDIEIGDFNLTALVTNNHTASDSCSQPIESITIFVRPDSGGLSPGS